MKTFQTLACLVLLMAPLAAAHSQGKSWTNEITADQAKAHVHERAAVSGRVYCVSWDNNVYVDFGGFCADAVFTAVIPNANHMVSQLVQLEGKEIVVRGRITTNSFGIPQIRVKSADRILMIGPDNKPVPLDLDPAPPTSPSQPTNAAPKEDTASWLSIFAADPDETNTFVTLSGRTYPNAKVIQVEPDGLTIKYAPTGVGLSETKLSFDELPPNLQQMYGFNAQIAAEYIEEHKAMENLSDAEKQNRERRSIHEELAARGAEVQRLYERKKRAYEEEKSDYDAKFKLGAWHDAERLAEVGELKTRQAEYQSAIRQQQLIQSQLQLNLILPTNSVH